ncbi:MAG: PilN domain-containing protein [Planctomycetota bacterium]
MTTRSVNLIPPSTQRRHAVRRVMRVMSAWVTATGLVAGLLLAVEWARGVADSSELASLRARYTPVATLVDERADLIATIERLRGREQLSLRLSHGAHAYALLGVTAQAAAESSGSVYLRQLNYSAAEESAKPGEPISRGVKLSGASIDGVAVADFAERLRESGLFRSVAVESTAPLPGGQRSLRRFEVACRF